MRRSLTRVWLIGSVLLLDLQLQAAVDIRWSLSSNRIYVIGPGTATLTDIRAAVPNAPLALVDEADRIWYLGASLVVQSNAQLQLYGPAIGGDVAVLRLKSDNTRETNAIAELTADWGWLDIRHTKITSWDGAVNGPDKETDTYGRAFVRVRSTLDADGVTAHESRMDVIESEIGYLGYSGAETYGLTWKVVGDYDGSANSIFDRVKVYGDVQSSRVHHNYYGIYTFGLYRGRFVGNQIDHNIGYGLDPHDDSDDLLVEDNDVHHNGWDGIIASKRCDHLVVRGNRAQFNGQNGIILHRSSNDCLLENNICVSNGTAGIVLAGGWRCVVRQNRVVANREAGIRLNLGSADNLIEGNEVASNRWYGFFLYKGSDATEPGDDGRPKRNLFLNNRVHSNRADGIRLADSDDNTFEGNEFVGNGPQLYFLRGFTNTLANNQIPENVIVKTLGSPFDAVSTYIRGQPLVRVQVDAYSKTVFEDSDGQIFDADENKLGTVVTEQGSTLVLTAAEIGTSSTVVARPVWVDVSRGPATVHLISWMDDSGAARRMTARVPVPGDRLTWKVGGLEPSRLYAVFKEGLPLMSGYPDASGRMTFTDAAESTNSVLYSIESAGDDLPRISFEKVGNELLLSWPEGELQHSATLFPPRWQDLATTNGQLRIVIPGHQPMEFFRVVR